MSSAVSPLAPKHVPDMPPIAGVRLATGAPASATGPHRCAARAVRSGHRGRGRVHAVEMPVRAGRVVPRASSRRGKARALVVNSGNANAFTGKTGRAATRSPRKLAGEAAGCKPAEVFLASTGVIGEPLVPAEFDGVMDGLVASAAPGRLVEAAKAIMTTDTFPKVATAR